MCPAKILSGGAGAGTIKAEGHIACHCKQCRAHGKVRSAGVSCSEFEEHAGSRERRPGESIYLTRLSISLKVQSMPLWGNFFLQTHHHA